MVIIMIRRVGAAEEECWWTELDQTRTSTMARAMEGAETEEVHTLVSQELFWLKYHLDKYIFGLESYSSIQMKMPFY